MIHVATVHWRDDRWVDVQLAYLERGLDEPYRVYAFLGRMKQDHSDKFFYSSTERLKNHAAKLNLLGDMIGLAADPDDIVLFIDGDAFPVVPLAAPLRAALAEHPLVAVRRDENRGARQPHPCFCATTVGFWRQIGGDWHRGSDWKGGSRRWAKKGGNQAESDVGYRVLNKLERAAVDWQPLLRSNTTELHPLFYAVYGGLIYHHGAGFRRGLSGLVLEQHGESELTAKPLARLLDNLPKSKLTHRLHRRYHPARRLRRRLVAEQRALSESVFDDLAANPEFYRRFLEPLHLDATAPR